MTWLKNIWTELIAIALISLVIVLGYKDYQRREYEKGYLARAEAPATQWLEVSSIYIPDFVYGQDPIIVYDRSVKKTFNGTWSVEIKPLNHTSELLPTICSGSGTAHYEVGEQVDPSRTTLSWFTGKPDCPPQAGRYMGIVYYEIRPENGYPTKNLQAFTNIFTVLPTGSQLYITPEQVERLEKVIPTPTDH